MSTLVNRIVFNRMLSKRLPDFSLELRPSMDYYALEWPMMLDHVDNRFVERPDLIAHHQMRYFDYFDYFD